MTEIQNDYIWLGLLAGKTCGTPLICHLCGGWYYTKGQTKVKKKIRSMLDSATCG